MKSIICTFFLLLMAICHANNYLPESKIDGSSTNGMMIFGNQSDCQSHYGENCILIPVGYSKEYHRLINTKSQAESCSSDQDCQGKLEIKSCLDGEIAIKVLDSDPKEVYCTKKAVTENAGLKASYEAAVSAKASYEAALALAIKAQQCGKRVMALMLVRNAQKGLSKNQRKQLVQTYKDIKDLLDAGSLDVAKDEIQAVNADGTLVTAADKTALVAELDSCQ
jgi:hypothetical protein